MLKIRMCFSKTGAAAFLSHLDVMRTFSRSFIRAGIPLRHTEGFNPHPYLSIAHPLPVGFTSDYELIDCEIIAEDTNGILERMNASLPDGFRILAVDCPVFPITDIAFAEYVMTYCYDGTMPADAAERLNAFFAAPEIIVTKKGKKGFTEINLKDYFTQIAFTRTTPNEINGSVVLVVKEAPLNPRYFTQAILDAALHPDFSRYRRAGYFNKEMKRFN